MPCPQIARAFGDLGGLPTLFLFDGSGRRVETFYGDPPTLHGAAEARIQSILPTSGGSTAPAIGPIPVGKGWSTEVLR